MAEGGRTQQREAIRSFSLGDLDEVVLPALKVKKGRIRVSYTAAHRSL
ncbi:hypothetical protein [Streptomyces sp. NPDC004685]